MGVEEIDLEEAPALLVEAGRDVGIVYAHGGSEDGKHLFLEEAVGLSRLGATVLLPASGIPLRGEATADDEAIRRAVRVQRSAVAALASAGATRFGFFGHSGGALQGAILAADEPRLSAVVLAAIGVGVARRAADVLPDPRPSKEAYSEALDRFEPTHFLRHPGERRLLFQHGRLDPVVSQEAARELYASAAGPKSWREYEADHGGVAVDPDARGDRFEFFRRELDFG